MNLVLYNRVIDADVEDVVNKLRVECDGKYLRNIRKKSDYVFITCPFHKDGQEVKPSCTVYNRTDNDKVPYGTFHCFTCNSKGPLYKLVSKVLNLSYEQAKYWLIENFSTLYEDKRLYLDDFIKTKKLPEYLDESILEQYKYYHPYQFKRGMTKEIIKKFSVGYDIKTDSITFPVWDEVGNLLGITKRSVKGKQFYIPSNMNKPVYLLNFVKQENITEVIVCEGQIDALVAWSRGIPAVALFGAGTTDKQIELLDKSGIRHFILMYDNDLAGQHGAMRLKQGLSKDKLITEVIMPKGKDISSCTTQEFYDILKNYNINIKNVFT